MAAIIGLSEGEVQAVCQEVTRVFVASINSSYQVVISGEEEAVEKAIQLCVQRGALLAKRLPIGWAIHTPLMERAARAFAQEIKDWQIRPPRFPVLSYLRAEFLKTPEEIKQELSAQFSQPNCWHKVLLRMVEEGIDTFIEVGPGNVLSQMVRWVSRSALTLTAEEVVQKGNTLTL
jgi:[acyl-carrier-protein] S-malonyltransferase